MDKATAIREVLKAKAALQAEGITHVWLFGSVARGEAGPTSDVDLFFEHNIERFGMLEYVGVKQAAEALLPFQVDFIERGCLHPKMLPRIEADAEQIF